MSDTNTAAPAAAPSTAPVDATDTSEETLAEGDAAEEAEEAKAAPVASAKRKFSAKVNGRQQEVELDTGNDAEVLKYIQKAMAADEKFQEAASLRKNVEMLVNELKTNPRAVLSHPELGLDIKKFAQDILNEELEELQKTPEQKELESLKKELQDKDKRLKAEEEGKRGAEMERLREQSFKQFDDDLTSALSSSSLPKSPYVIKRVADTLIEAVNLGFVDVTVHDILPIVEQQMHAEHQDMYGNMSEDAMEKIIGKNNLNRLRKKRLSQRSKPIETPNSIKETGQKTEEDGVKKPDRKMRFGDLYGKF